MRISLIVAMDRRGVIGRGNELPWRLPADLAWFKRMTMGKPIIMGRRTHESIGRALPGRLNVVLSRGDLLLPQGCVHAASREAALELVASEDEVMIIGGAGIYTLFAPVVNRLYRTTVQAEVDGDVHFPEFSIEGWTSTLCEERPRDEKNGFDLVFEVFDR
jgi:dihydrofolate reductase